MSANRTRILIVEEEPILLDIVAFRLELLGFAVVTASAADQALAWLAENIPDLVAVGYVADMDSIDFLNRLRDDARTSGTPALLLSANSDLDAVQRAYNAGADEYLLIPFDPLMLENKVQTLLDRRPQLAGKGP